MFPATEQNYGKYFHFGIEKSHQVCYGNTERVNPYLGESVLDVPQHGESNHGKTR
jgi:hypothetical protein